MELEQKNNKKQKQETPSLKDRKTENQKKKTFPEGTVSGHATIASMHMSAF